MRKLTGVSYMGPTLPISEEIHSTKYRGPGESFEDAMTRVANATKDNEEHFFAFREILLSMRFMPAGRVQAAMGSLRNTTPYNCFVSGTIEDNFTGTDGIMARATEAAQTMRMGGGIGYDFSTLRPRGDIIRSLDSRASGPLSFAAIYDAVGLATASAGHRRGAQMLVLRVDHPDIEEFIYAKQNTTKLTGFNISVGITDAFMKAVIKDKPFNLVWIDFKQGFDVPRVYKTIRARALWEQLMRSTWDYAEPGVLFIDTINKMNNLYYCEYIAATNPCGEQPLPPYGACLLGSFNLTKYIVEANGKLRFNYPQLKEDIPHVVRAMDNVVDRATYPLRQHRKEALSKRRMGLGVAGLANALEVLGYPYGSKGFLDVQARIMRTIMEEAYRASALLGEEKGSFPLYDPKKYLVGKFIKKLPADIRALIEEKGMRNSHLLSIAPTGTISLAADNISGGIEPVFSHSYDRTVMTFEGPKVETVSDYAFREWGVKGKTAMESSADDHVNVLLEASKYVDSAVSKTCNVSPDMPWEDFKNLYIKAWKGGAKGCTTYNPGGKRAGILVAKEEVENTACFIDPETGAKSCE